MRSSGGSSKPGVTPSLISRSSIGGRLAGSRPRHSELLEHVLGVDPSLARDASPGAVRLELPGLGIVAQLDLKNLRKTILKRGVLDGDHSLDPAVQVARHQVGRAQVVLDAVMFGPEPKDPGVFQEAADDGPHPNPLRESGHTGPQAAHAADDQVDLRSSLRGFVECIDNLRVVVAGPDMDIAPDHSVLVAHD